MQRLETKIRSHIKVELEMKIYMDHLEDKVFQYRKHIKCYKDYISEKLQGKESDKIKFPE